MIVTPRSWTLPEHSLGLDDTDTLAQLSRTFALAEAMRTSKSCRAVVWLTAALFLIYHIAHHIPTRSSSPERLVRERDRWADQKAEAIKEAFRFSWDQYEKFAAPHDTLRPVSQSFEDDR